MSASPFQELDRILSILKKMGLPHALIGGWAVVAWGFLRASEDLDLMMELPSSQRRKLLNALSKDYETEWREGGQDDPIPGLIRARPRAEGAFPVDFLVVRGRNDRAAINRAATIVTDGVSIPIVRPEDLIAMKLEVGGGQDYEDARRLLSILTGKLDESKLNEYCRDRNVLDRLVLLRR